jgi:hypothetical protein
MREEVLTLLGREASNIVGALGEVIACDFLRRKMGISCYKIGINQMFPPVHPYYANAPDDRYVIITRKQAELVADLLKKDKVSLDKFVDLNEPFKEYTFLSKKQAEFVKNKVANQIMCFDYLGIKWKHQPFYGLKWCGDRGDFAIADTTEIHATVKDVKNVYLIEVKTGRKENVKRYIRNPLEAFKQRYMKGYPYREEPLKAFEVAKALGFKVILVVVELLDDWKYKVSCREL